MASFRACIFILVIFSGAPAMAASLTGSSPGYHYFYKQGATMDEHDSAIIGCAVRTRALSQGAGISEDLLMQSAPTGGYGGGFVGGALAGLIGSIVDSNEERQGNAANIENCMALNGWSVVGIDDVEGESGSWTRRRRSAIRCAPLSRRHLHWGLCCADLSPMNSPSEILRWDRRLTSTSFH